MRLCLRKGCVVEIPDRKPGQPGVQRKWCSENCRKRASAENNRQRCIDCGDLLSEGSAWRGYVRCTVCKECQEAERVDDRARKIVAWWAEGLEIPDIARRLGWTVNHLSVELYRLRAKGYALPYRYTEGKRAGSRFPEQVAA